MKWEILSTEQQFLDFLDNESLFAIFKHSTRCSISSMAKNRVERDWDLDFFMLFTFELQCKSISIIALVHSDFTFINNLTMIN